MIDKRLLDFAEEVMRVTSQVCGVTRAELVLRLKKQPTRLILPRYIGWKILYTKTVHFRDRNGNRVMSYARIGQIYGGFCHATVIYGIKQCSIAIGEYERIPYDAAWKLPYDMVIDELTPAISKIALDGEVFFTHDENSYRKAGKFLYDIGEFAACRGTRTDVIDKANLMLERYKL